MPARLQEQLSVVGAAFSRANTVTTTIMRSNLLSYRQPFKEISASLELLAIQHL